MITAQYRTKTIFMEADNKKVPGVWPVGLDIGYSGVKVFSGNAIVCFPSYASVSSVESRISIASDTDDDSRSIMYMDEHGTIWDVGADAQDMISVSDTSAGSLAIYGRSRYYSPMFKVIMRVGIAAGIRTNRFGGPEGKALKIQTGLPPKYIISDTADLLSVMAGHHVFKVKFGSGDWESFDFILSEQDISIMDQPEGTLFSIATDRDIRLTKNAARYFNANLLIVDPGFGTLDLFPMFKKKIDRDACQTYPELGMKQVLKDTANEILRRHNFEVSVPAMQKFLETGLVYKREGRRITKVPFDDILEACSRAVCDKTVDKIFEVYGPTLEFDYIVLTGGTGEAWFKMFQENEYLKDCGTVQVIPGNYGDESLPWLFSNVRGYFIFMVTRFAARR